MKTIIHRKQDIIDIARYLLQNYDSKFEFVIEPILCRGKLENGLGIYADTPVWVMRAKFSQGYEADGAYTEVFGRLVFSTAYKDHFDFLRRNHCQTVEKGKTMTLEDEHRTYHLGYDANGAFVRTDFKHFASTQRQALMLFSEAFPDYQPQSVQLKLIETDIPAWVVMATNLARPELPARKFYVEPIGFVRKRYIFDVSAEPFDKQKEYFLFDPHRHWIGCARHIMGVKWEKGMGLVPMTLSQMTQPLPVLGFDRFDPHSPACRSILD